MLSNTENKSIFNWKLVSIMISDIYVRIEVAFHPLIGACILLIKYSTFNFYFVSKQI